MQYGVGQSDWSDPSNQPVHTDRARPRHLLKSYLIHVVIYLFVVWVHGFRMQLVHEGGSVRVAAGVEHTITAAGDGVVSVWSYVHSCEYGELHRALQLLSNEGVSQ